MQLFEHTVGECPTVDGKNLLFLFREATCFFIMNEIRCLEHRSVVELKMLINCRTQLNGYSYDDFVWGTNTLVFR